MLSGKAKIVLLTVGLTKRHSLNEWFFFQNLNLLEEEWKLN